METPKLVPFENYQFVWKCFDCDREVQLPITFQEENGNPVCDCNDSEMTLMRLEQIKE